MSRPLFKISPAQCLSRCGNITTESLRRPLPRRGLSTSGEPPKHRTLFTVVNSLFAAGGLGAVVLGLASKELAEELVGGLAARLHGNVNVGDEVKLGDGTEGIVKRTGWVTSEIRGYDDLVVHIPNSQLIHQRVSNVTTSQRCQVKQILRFKYSDLKKVPGILEDIKEETRKSCPKLISDGTAIYRAVITKFEPDHVEAMVNFHFDISPSTEADAVNRQQVLLAIARAVEKNEVEFALPSIRYQTSN